MALRKLLLSPCFGAGEAAGKRMMLTTQGPFANVWQRLCCLQTIRGSGLPRREHARSEQRIQQEALETTQ